MVSCPKCGAVVFIDMDGGAHVASPESNSVANSNSDSVGTSTAEPSDLEMNQFLGVNPDFHSSNSDVGPSFGVVSDSPSDLQHNIASTTDTASAEKASSISDQYSNQDNASQFDPSDPLGISAYANSEISGAVDGPLVVTLIVSGIDTKDNRDEIRQALQDPRFGWDANALMAGLKGGELRLERITPVKATIVVNRIKHLAVQIRWEQSAITELDPQEPEKAQDT